MSYFALARRWRPQAFSDFVGHENVLNALRNSLQRQHIHHAYLFTGTRGVGKTSLARLFAKSISCAQGVCTDPCGVCDACTRIAQNRYLDLIEIDAASRTKVEDTRELLSQVAYPPVSGRYKIYLIDEVHMLSTHSFNALLKTLEEPPEKTIFLLATTDPQKLPVTVQSRCLQFHLPHVPSAQISAHLKHVLHEQKCDFTDAAVDLIAHAAAGSVRDSMSLLEQALCACPSATDKGPLNLDAQIVQSMLGHVADDVLEELLQALYHKDNTCINKILATLAEHNHDYKAILSQLLSKLYQISYQQILTPDKTPSTPLVSQFSREWCQICIQLTLQTRQDLELYPDHFMAFSILVMRMHAFKPDNRSITELIQKHSTALSPETTPAPQPDKPFARPQLPTPDNSVHTAATVANNSATPITPSGSTPWADLICGLDGMARAVLRESTLNCDVNDTNWSVHLPKGSCSMLSAALRQRILSHVQTHHQHVVQIEYIPTAAETTGSPTAAAVSNAQPMAPKTKESTSKINTTTPASTDPVLKQLQETLDATIIPSN